MSKDKPNHDQEILCGFKVEDLKLFHTGKLSSNVFPVEYNKAHLEKIPHIIVRIFVKTKDDKYLVQKRSEQKRTHKGRWTDSASGHVRYVPDFSYENIEENIKRELMEEMGCDLLAIRFIQFTNDQIDKQDSELCYIFLGICGDSYKLDLEEVDPKSGLFTKSQLKELLELPRSETEKPWVEIARQYWVDILDGKYDNLFSNMFEEIELNQKISENISKNPINKKKNGLIIGRFQPLHLGHLSLIKKCFEYVTYLKIGIGSSQISNTLENPFTYEERKLFIDLSLSDEKIHPNSYQIYAIPDKFDLYKWMDSIFDIIGDFDIVFTNNLWIGRLFQLRNKQMVYGFKFEFERFNGTHIRDLLYCGRPQYLELISPSVSKYITQPEILKRLNKIKKQKLGK